MVIILKKTSRIYMQDRNFVYIITSKITAVHILAVTDKTINVILEVVIHEKNLDSNRKPLCITKNRDPDYGEDASNKTNKCTNLIVEEEPSHIHTQAASTHTQHEIQKIRTVYIYRTYNKMQCNRT